MFKRTNVYAGVLVALGGALLVTAAPAYAQSAQRVEITGSLIKRLQSEAAVPVVTLQAEELAKAGATNAEQVVKLITQAQGGTVTSASVSGTNGAASYASLRALGASRTLVLINGKRMVTNPFASAAVDLNSIPIGAIERVETLPDGASAVYGTDAIAGVINFVMKKSYSGIILDAAFQKTQEGGGDVTSGSIVAGFGDLATQGFNIYGAINYRDQKPLGGDERDFMRSSYQPERGFNGLSPTSGPANYSQDPDGTGPLPTVIGNPALAAGCAPPLSIRAPEPNGTFIRCFADTQAITKVIPIQEQTGFLLKGSLALGANHTASLELIQTKNVVQSQIAPSPEGGLTVSNLSPFFPGGSGGVAADPRLNASAPINVNWRTVVLGARAGKQENITNRAALSLEGSLGDWFYQATALTSTSEVENFFLNGYPQTTALRNGTLGTGVGGAPALNPFGAQTPAGLAFLQANQVLGKVQDGKGTLSSVTASISGSIFKLPAGEVQVAANIEQRNEDNVYNTDVPKVSQAASSGLAGSGATRSGERDITAISAEIIIPVLKNLELSGSLRQDRYSDFGSTTNPKIAFRFQPTEMVVLRGSYNTGFSAPTLTSLYSPQSTTFTGNRYNDPLLCPGGIVAANGRADRDCGIQFQRLQGGNPNLDAEKSKAWSLGFAIQPTSSITLSADFWNYYIEDNISTAGEQSIFADPVRYADLFIRCSAATAALQASLGACQNRGGADPLAYIVDSLLNLGDTKTQGVDIGIRWQGGATSYGRFSASLNGSYTHRYEFQLEPGGRWFTPVGNYSPQFGGPVIRYQQNARVNWEAANWSLSLGNRYTAGYRDQNANSAPFNVAPFNTNTVKAYSLFDASVSYSGVKGLTLGLGIENLLDKDPPFTNQLARFQARAYDDRFHNPLGRTFRFSARYEY